MVAGKLRILRRRSVSYHGHAMTRTLAIGCALAMAAACLAQNQPYHAKIAVDNGASLPATPLFIPPPPGENVPPCRIVDAFANGMVNYTVPLDRWTEMSNPSLADKCAITISLRGYKRITTTLHEGAVIVLKQAGGDPEGSTISVTALHIPKDAAKAYDKGISAMGDDKFPAAENQFERAVAVYPEYAQAWSQLGEVLEQESKPREAVDACEHALQAEPKYIRPYLQLMRIAVSEKRMQDAAALGDRAIRLNPVEFPGIYYYDAVASYDLKHADVAEKTAREAIDLDKAHGFPAAEEVLGKVLADKGDLHGALVHFRKYVELAPKADDVPAIQQRIADLERTQAQAKDK
jgi:tetratricopeptide (TPR) repeat protein